MTEQAAQRWVEVSGGRAAWAEAATEVLTDVASHYDGLITQADLAEQVQSLSGLRTRSPYRAWIGSVLGLVVAACRRAALPPLTSLVVHRPGGDPETDLGTLRARLSCYRRFAVDVPAEAIAQADALARAEAAAAEQSPRRSTPRAPRAARAPRTTTTPRRSPTREEAPPKICPTCFVQLPASGICDTCS